MLGRDFIAAGACSVAARLKGLGCGWGLIAVSLAATEATESEIVASVES